jgi:hypothetical protein
MLNRPSARVLKSVAQANRIAEPNMSSSGANGKPGLPQLLAALQNALETELTSARVAIGHPGTKGTESEDAWVKVLNRYLPKRYVATRATVIDSSDNQSDQIDIVIHDRQYTPWVLKMNSARFVPAEAVYAVFEVKQTLNKGHVEYAAKKVASVRQLKRTSLPIVHAGGQHEAVEPRPILGGILTLCSDDWTPALGDPLQASIAGLRSDGRLDLGCVMSEGVFCVEEQVVQPVTSEAPLALFLLELIAQLQDLGTVPRIDVRAYARWAVSG